jgi:hypothetical protein
MGKRQLRLRHADLQCTHAPRPGDMHTLRHLRQDDRARAVSSCFLPSSRPASVPVMFLVPRCPAFRENLRPGPRGVCLFWIHTHLPTSAHARLPASRTYVPAMLLASLRLQADSIIWLRPCSPPGGCIACGLLRLPLCCSCMFGVCGIMGISPLYGTVLGCTPLLLA